MSYKKRGFTLIELLIVIAIIGILSGVTLAVINPQKLRDRAQDATRKEDLATIAGALERYYADNNQYIRIATYQLANTFLDNYLVDEYINVFPSDPAGNNNYMYKSVQSGQGFCLCAYLREPDFTGNQFNGCTNVPSPRNYCIREPF